MPKGYGYDKAPKKSAAFKMKGFSYAGNSPMKGKRKQMELQAAADKKYGAMDAITDAMGEMGGMTAEEGTNLFSAEPTQYGSPVAKKAPLKNIPVGSFSTQQKLGGNLVVNQELMNTNVPEGKKSFGESFKAAMGTEIGQAAGKALVEGAINLGVNALANRKKKEPKRRVNAADAFSRINITGRS